MGELDDMVEEAIRVAFKLTLVTCCCAVSAYIGYTNLASTGVFEGKKEEKTLSYESESVRQLAHSAMKKFGCSEREIDKDSNGMISESEVISYVRKQ